MLFISVKSLVDILSLTLDGSLMSKSLNLDKFIRLGISITIFNNCITAIV